MKRFSVLVVVLFCLGYIITNFNKADFSPDNMANEILAEDKDASKENKDQNIATEKDSSANTDAKFVSDINVSDKQVVSGTDNKANLRELYYKDGYIYFKYLMAKNDEFSVGGVTYVQTNKAKFEVKLVEENPYVNPPAHPDGYELTEKDKYKGETTVTIKQFNEDFGRVYVGEIAEGEVYGGITARVTTYYVAKDAYSNGLSMTRTVDYRIYMN